MMALPKRDLKTRLYNIDINKKDLKRLSKLQFIKLLLKQEANEFENSIASPTNQEKSVSHKSVNDYEDLIIEPPEQFRDRQKKRRPPKPKRKPPPILEPEPLNDFDDDIFQTENTSLGKFKIISIQSRENKKFKSYINEFKVKILKKLDDLF